MITELNEMFKEILEFAERNQECLRKAVGCAAITITNDKPVLIEMVHNGPSRKRECTNEVGNCGCSHSEPRLVQAILEKNIDIPLIMLCTYSPCTNCANIIIDSKLFKGIIYQILTEHDKRGAQFLIRAMPVRTVEQINTIIEREVIAELKKWISSPVSN